MITLLGIGTVVLISIIVFQLSRTSELLKSLKGEEPNEISYGSNRTQAILLVAFMVVGLAAALFGYLAVADQLQFPGGHPASVHGKEIDNMFLWTSIICGIAFVITQVALFYFSFKYRARKGHKAEHYSHDNKLEVIWTVIPAIVLTILVAMGIENWYKITDTAPAEATIVEVTGEQFKWTVRYPGKDGELGAREFGLIDGFNGLGVNWDDKNSHDDIFPNELHLEVNKPVLFKLGAKDVLHSFYLSHFRLKMDCVPGIPTQFWMTPTITTDSMRQITGNPDFNYELACAELCGRGHWNMGFTIVVEKPEEYQKWLAEQTPFYESIKDQLKAANDTPVQEPAKEEVPAEGTEEQLDTESSEEAATGSTEEVKEIVTL